MKNQKLKVGRVDNKRLDQFNMPIRERESVKFALTGLPANVARLFVGGVLIAQCTPTYDGDMAVLNMLGEDVCFHRALISPDVECVLQIECERVHDFTTMPSMRVGFNRDSVKEMPASGSYEQKVIIMGVEKTLVYTVDGCSFA